MCWERILGSGAQASTLESRIQNWNPETTLVGDVFCYFGNFFRMYTGFSNGFPEASKTIVKLSNDRPAFLQLLQHALSEGHENIQSLMIKPVQRIPRYKLLLKECLKYTSVNHPDHQHLKSAFATISSVAAHINETLRRYENQAKIIEN